ncbi:MAG TPA: hypothetical protein VNF69_09790 [Burkholderiales bacterium]|nr:hypothetical protein [Burkholderiales bacterium]
MNHLVRGIACELRKPPGYGTRQLFFHDPSGAKRSRSTSPPAEQPA